MYFACIYAYVIKLFSNNDFSVLSMSVMVFQRSGGGGGVKLGPSRFFIIIRRCDKALSCTCLDSSPTIAAAAFL